MHEHDHDDLINNVDHENNGDHKFDEMEYSNSAQIPM